MQMHHPGDTPRARLIIRLRPVIDGVAWLEDAGAYVDIFVGTVSADGDR